MDWAAIQDWMCEPHMLKRTGLSVREHQARTVESYLDLMSIDPTTRWVAVLQGWALQDYLDHVEQYARAGVDLLQHETVGLGSVCRRQGTSDFVVLVDKLHSMGLRLHGFGVKTLGLAKVADKLVSSDSLAWSLGARRLQKVALPECEGGTHKNCANCMPYALHWRRQLLAKLPENWRD